MDEIKKSVKKGGVSKLLNADDLLLLGDSWEEVKMINAQWKNALPEKGWKPNVKNMNAFLTGERTVTMETLKFLCSVCGGG